MSKSMLFKISYRGPTNTLGSYCVITNEDCRHRNNERPKRRKLPYSYEHGDILKQGIETLKQAGFKIESLAETKDAYFILCAWDWNTLAAFYGLEVSA